MFEFWTVLERKCDVTFVVFGRILVLVFYGLIKILVNNLGDLLLCRKNVKIRLKKEKQHFLLKDFILKKTHLGKSSIMNIHMVIKVS